MKDFDIVIELFNRAAEKLAAGDYTEEIEEMCESAGVTREAPLALMLSGYVMGIETAFYLIDRMDALAAREGEKEAQ